MLECSVASDLKCSYTHDASGLYTCVALNLQLEKDNPLIDSVKGEHLPGKEQINVERLMVVCSSNKFLSSDIFQKFPNLLDLSVLLYSVENIVQGNFHGAQHLRRIIINNNYITQLTDNIFSGAPNLEIIQMNGNSIYSLSIQTFAGLTKLETLYLEHSFINSLPKGIFDELINLRNVSFFGNMFKSLDGDLFKNNLKITHLWLSNNQLSVIGSNLITHLQSLEIAEFYNNPCISSSLYDSVNVNALSEKIAECTESNKPEQKLLLAENQKEKDTVKIDLLSILNEVLREKITEKIQEIETVKQKLNSCQMLNQINKY